MKGDSNRFLARNDGSGERKGCGGAVNIGLLGFTEFPSATEICKER